jgi:hypothetical protein
VNVLFYFCQKPNDCYKKVTSVVGIGKFRKLERGCGEKVARFLYVTTFMFLFCELISVVRFKVLNNKESLEVIA